MCLEWSLVSKPAAESLEEKRRRFEQLAMPAIDALYRYAMKLTNNNRADADDLVQDTYERAFKAFDSFREGTNIEAWMTTIEKNLYINGYKKSKRGPQRANGSTGEYDDWEMYTASECGPDGMKSAEQKYMEGFTLEEIMAALERLNPDQRQVFVETCINGKTYQQVADVQGVKLGTVMSRLNRARTQLKRELLSLAKERGYGSPSAKSSKKGDNNASADAKGSAGGDQ